MKRKINPGNPQGVKELKLSEGIPRLERTISETGPSIPSDEEHGKVQVVQKQFGLAEDSITGPMMNLSSGLNSVHGRIRYSSENDVANLVKIYLEKILYALGVGDVEIHSEIATFNIRPDLWVVSVRGVPIGIVEVKKPDVPGKPKALEHANVLGELYDFLRHLPNFHGVSPAFGILTNMNTWRMAWLPTASGNIDVDRVAAQPEKFDVQEENEDDASDPVEGGQEECRPMPSTQEEDEIMTQDDPASFLDDSSKRLMHVSRIFRKDEPEILLRAITSVLCKMIRSTATPFPTPFANLEHRTILKFERSEACSTYWARITVKPQWNKVASPKKFLFAIQDLGRGTDGRVWLTCTTSGAICVLKFPLDGKAETIDFEHSIWEAAYPSIRTYKETWCGHVALRMPYFAPIGVNERAGKIELIRDTLTVNFANKKLLHGDVFWRNIGIYVDHQTGEERAVVYDMGRVTTGTAADTKWVEDACNRLLSAASSEAKEQSEEYY